MGSHPTKNSAQQNQSTSYENQYDDYPSNPDYSQPTTNNGDAYAEEERGRYDEQTGEYIPLRATFKSAPVRRT